jgi:hypothetical protein
MSCMMGVLLKVLRVGLGLALVLGTSGVAALCFSLALRPSSLLNLFLFAFVALFFVLQACAVWKILLFPHPADSLMRAVTGGLGVAGLTAIAVNSYSLFYSFGFWRLLLVVLGLPGAAMFLFFAFYREPGWSLPGPGGGRGSAFAGVTWPRPTRPPVLTAAAAQSLPKPSEWTECRGIGDAERWA